MRTAILAAMALLTLSACALPVKKVAYQDAAPVPETAHPAPFRLSNILLRLPLGHDIGNYGSQTMNFCFSGNEAERSLLTRNIDLPSARKAFYQTMAGLGYDVTGSEDFLFEEEADDDWLRTEFKIGAKITNARMDACHQEPGLLEGVLNRSYGDKGALYLEVEWSIYDSLRKTTVYKVATEGYVDRRRANYEGLALMFNDAFSMAAHNLAADQAFHALMIDGKRPPRDLWQLKKKDHAEGRRKFDAGEDVAIANPPLSQEPLQQHIADVRNIAVMVEGGTGHGSGFFITGHGHILTNAHVVGDALRVRVVSAHRGHFRVLGTRQNFIQADIETHGGNSGGPLLDQYGNLAGLSVAGYTENDAGIGLNLFVPIDEALKTLNITLSENEKHTGSP